MSIISYLLSPFFPQEVHWCGLLCYFHHRHPRLHCSGYCWWVWDIADDYITHTFHNNTQLYTQIRTCRTVVKCSVLIEVCKCELFTPPVLPGCTKQNLLLVKWVERWKGIIIYHKQNEPACLHRMHRLVSFFVVVVWLIHIFWILYSTNVWLSKVWGSWEMQLPQREQWAIA